MIFSKEKAEAYYKKYMENYVDDAVSIARLAKQLSGKQVLLLAPGKSITVYKNKIHEAISENTCIISVNSFDKEYSPQFVFVGNIRRFNTLIKERACGVIATSNIPDYLEADYYVNFSSVTGNNNEVFDNSGLMALRLLQSLGIKEVTVAGMDGYLETDNYYKDGFEIYNPGMSYDKNRLISNELKEIARQMKIRFLTPTSYSF